MAPTKKKEKNRFKPKRPKKQKEHGIGKSEAGRRKSRIVVLFVLAILFSVTITEFAYFFYKVKYVRVYDLKLEVSDKIGFALGSETSQINFGAVPPGSSVTRNIFLLNNYTLPLLVSIVAKGSINEFIYIDNNVFVMQQGESKEIPIHSFVPEGTCYGNYSGKLTLIFKRI